MKTAKTILAVAMLIMGGLFLGYQDLVFFVAFAVIFGVLEFVFSNSFERFVGRFVTITD